MKPGVLRNTVGAVTSGVVRLALGGRVETSAVLADVFANIIGNSIGDRIEASRAAPAASGPSGSATPEGSATTAANGTRPSSPSSSPTEPVYDPSDRLSPDEQAELQEIVVTGYRDQPGTPAGAAGSGGSVVGRVVGRAADGRPLYATGTGGDMQGVVTRIDDATSGLKWEGARQYNGQELHAYQDEAGQRAWGYTSGDELKFVNWVETKLEYTNEDVYGISQNATDRRMAEGKTGAGWAMLHALGKVGYEAHNAITLGFVKREDQRITLNARGYLSDGDTWRARSIDFIGTAASVYAGGRAGSIVINRLGTGYRGVMASGGAAGGVTDLGHQLTQMSIYSATDGSVGQAQFSPIELASATTFGAATGGVLKFAGNSQLLNRPLQSPLYFDLQRGATAYSGIPIGVRTPFATVSSRLSQPGGLSATEGSRILRYDGRMSEPTHPLLKHGPEVTDAYIKGRVFNELVNKNRTGLRTAFRDRASMEGSIAETIMRRQADIDRWLATSPRPGVPRAFGANPGMGNLGRGFEVVTRGGPVVPIARAMPNVNVVLIPNGRGGYLIHTAHPF
jgi:hypothetical protein